MRSTYVPEVKLLRYRDPPGPPVYGATAAFPLSHYTALFWSLEEAREAVEVLEKLNSGRHL